MHSPHGPERRDAAEVLGALFSICLLALWAKKGYMIYCQSQATPSFAAEFDISAARAMTEHPAEYRQGRSYLLSIGGAVGVRGRWALK